MTTILVVNFSSSSKSGPRATKRLNFWYLLFFAVFLMKFYEIVLATVSESSSSEGKKIIHLKLRKSLKPAVSKAPYTYV